ncbi:22025_t:CDS:1, partial [Gigaspora margarita]
KSNMEDYDIKQKMNEEIRKVGKLCEVEMRVNFEELKIVETIQEKIKTIQEYKKIIYKVRKLENEIIYRQKIESHIKKRYNNFASNTKKMIDSILQRNKEPVGFRNIKKANQLITEPTEIKEKIKEHFEKWTKYNLVNMEE